MASEGVLDFHRSHSHRSLSAISCTRGTAVWVICASQAGPSREEAQTHPQEEHLSCWQRNRRLSSLLRHGLFPAYICRLLLVLCSFLTGFIIHWWHRMLCILWWGRQRKTGRDSAVRLLASELWLFDLSNLATGSHQPRSPASLQLSSGTPFISEMEFMAS